MQKKVLITSCVGILTPLEKTEMTSLPVEAVILISLFCFDTTSTFNVTFIAEYARLVCLILIMHLKLV